MKPPVLKSLYVALFTFLLAIAGNAQSNPVFQEFTILKDAPFTMTLESNPSAIVIDHLNHGWSYFSLSYESSGLYTLNYTPSVGFLGEDEMIIEFKAKALFLVSGHHDIPKLNLML